MRIILLLSRLARLFRRSMRIWIASGDLIDCISLFLLFLSITYIFYHIFLRKSIGNLKATFHLMVVRWEGLRAQRLLLATLKPHFGWRLVSFALATDKLIGVSSWDWTNASQGCSLPPSLLAMDTKEERGGLCSKRKPPTLKRSALHYLLLNSLRRARYKATRSNWSEWSESNTRNLGPKPSAIPLGDTPKFQPYETGGWVPRSWQKLP